MHRKLLVRGMVTLTGGALLLGAWIGMALQRWLPELAMGILILACVFGATGLSMVQSGRWRTANVEKGLDAETRIGQAIEYAVASPACAVAHGVTKIATVGDIDHIVLTPVRLWIIETKWQRVPRREFPKVLGRIAANVGAVRGWAPPGTNVQGCLVLASEAAGRGKRRYDARGEPILVEDLASLARRLRSEAIAPRDADHGLVRRVWALGKMAG